VKRVGEILTVLAIAGCGSLLSYRPLTASAAEPAAAKQAAPAPERVAGQASATGPAKLVVTIGKSLIIDSPLKIERISVANGDLAEAVAVKPNEILINGKAAGETSLIVWQFGGARLIYDLTVRISTARLDAVRQQIARDFPNENISVTFENDTAFVRGTVKDVTAADRVMVIASTLGKAVNLLNVQIPPVEEQVVLKVRFANVDRTASLQLSANFLSNAFNQTSAIGTGGLLTNGVGAAVNILLQRKDINFTAAIQALQAKNMLQMLAEPNLLAISGQQASFLAGGEFPFPLVQPSAGTAAISLMWREYGIRLNFLPQVTPRGTIRLKVAPEVSSLDFSNAVTVQGFAVPALSVRRVQTDVELESGQSFVIAGLLDNTTSETLSKIPGIGNIPVIGKLFQSKQTNRNNQELLVIITPEVVRPIPAGQKAPELKFPMEFMTSNSNMTMSQPGMDKTGPVPVKPPFETMPVELLSPAKQAAPAPVGLPAYQMVPVQPQAPPPSAQPGLTPAAMGSSGGTGK
jgi:pilus assembly protein CpaC